MRSKRDLVKAMMFAGCSKEQIQDSLKVVLRVRMREQKWMVEISRLIGGHPIGLIDVNEAVRFSVADNQSQSYARAIMEKGMTA